MLYPSNSKIYKILEKSKDVAERSALEAKSLVFMARPFVQTTLPHRNPGNVPEWYRKNGRLTLSIRSGWAENQETGERNPVGIPYGSIPRLLLFWMTTETLRTGNKLLDLGGSLSGFMRQIGLDPRHGGKRGDIGRLKDQMQRLFRSTISIDETLKSNTSYQNGWLDMQVVCQGNMTWFDTSDYKFNSVTDFNFDDNSWIELTDIFFQSITHSAVPLDMRIIQEIKQSPLALDLYAWMTHRTHSSNAPVESSRIKPSFVSWKQLHDQFGANYKNTKDFNKELKQLLKVVRAISNNLCIEEAYGGLSISQKFTIIK